MPSVFVVRIRILTLLGAAAWILGGVIHSQTVPDISGPPAQPSDNPKGPASATDPLADARALVDHGQLERAESRLRQALRSHPESAEAHFLLGYVFFRQIQAAEKRAGHIDPRYQSQQAKAALAEYTEGAKYRTPSAFDLKVVALNYVLLEDYADADQWLTKSVAMDGKDSDAWYYLGRTKYNENRFQEAIEAFKKCVELHPRDVKAEDNLGLSYAALERREDAMAAYRTAIDWQSDSIVKDAGPFIDRGTLLLEENHAKEAIPDLSQAVALSPQEFRAHRELGKAYAKTNELAKAQLELEKAVALEPQDAALHYVLGQIYRREGLLDKAKAEFARTAELNSNRSSGMNDRRPPPTGN
jgi:tetratricopeptide (TPR) repeat protein